ncbi:alpha/beta fold hydrolase [Paenibacillus ehimensis]|uniref:Alpha/beta hydrolase n=1 Tax=Paenibacillus ehimensis TaxID=79264 RepID=A0ABT8V797_9BACL|nr:alpha/beta hydrolase [Paenibacillus ehimensis]MDO3676608.1 alpha/beta hydrolase [Paenibacillus ehimensis]
MPFAKINGTTLYYKVKGYGVPIVFIHPPMLTSSNFADQMKQLSGKYQVIAFDIRGHGQSGQSSEPLTYGLLAEDIRGLLDHLELKKAYLCGYSTGGSVALEALLRYPDRFYGAILISGMSELSDWYRRSEVWAAVGMMGLRAKRIVAAVIALGNANKWKTFRRLYRTAKEGQLRNVNDYFKCSLTYNCTERLGQIQVPVLLLYGEKDKEFRRYAQILHRRLPDSTLHFLPKVGHQLPTKSSALVNALIRHWIDERHPWKTADKSRQPAPSLPVFPLPDVPQAEETTEV